MQKGKMCKRRLFYIEYRPYNVLSLSIPLPELTIQSIKILNLSTKLPKCTLILSIFMLLLIYPFINVHIL